jgi:hypothetical protein
MSSHSSDQASVCGNDLGDCTEVLLYVCWLAGVLQHPPPLAVLQRAFLCLPEEA